MRKSLLLLAILFTVGCVVTAALPVSADLADDTVYTEGALYYTVANDSITITGYFGRDEEVTVPAMIAGTPVNTIASGAFTGNKYLKTLKLPDTISKIENGSIGEDIRVIYNANTDHPQDTPTELILSNMYPEPTENPTEVPEETESPEATAEVEATETAAADATATPVPEETPVQEATEVPTAAAETETGSAPEETPEPTVTGDKIGEGDVDIDETPTPSPEEPADTAEPVATPEEDPTAAESTEALDPTDPAVETPSSGTEEPGPTPPDKLGNGMPVWGWVLIGAAALICAGGAVYAALAAKRKNK